MDADVHSLPDDMRARFVRIADLIEWAGLPQVHEPHVKHLRGAVWEMRLSGRAGIARALYVVVARRRVVVVRVFRKKTQAVPAHEIELALRRAGELNR